MPASDGEAGGSERTNSFTVRDRPAVMESYLQNNQSVAADVTTEIRLEPIEVEEAGIYQIKAGAFIKSRNDGTRADLLLKVNAQTRFKHTQIMASESPLPSLDQIEREFIYTDMTVEELDRRIGRAVDVEMDGEPVNLMLTANHVEQLAAGDTISLSVACEEQATVVSKVTGVGCKCVT